MSEAPNNVAPLTSTKQTPTSECPLVAFGSLPRLEILISLLAVILCEFIQRLGRTRPVTLHHLPDTFLKIAPANLRSPLRSTTYSHGADAFTRLSSLGIPDQTLQLSLTPNASCWPAWPIFRTFGSQIRFRSSMLRHCAPWWYSGWQSSQGTDVDKRTHNYPQGLLQIRNVILIRFVRVWQFNSSIFWWTKGSIE